jgi:NACalpha-BTF3-like transcription factor
MENEDIALTPPSDKELDSIKSFVEKPKDKEMKAEYPDTSDAVLQKALKGDPSDLYGQLAKYGIAKQQTQQELDKTRADREYQLAQNFANQEASLIKQAQSQMRPFNEFKPPKESVAQLGGMQAAMMLFAGLIGGKGAYGGIAALNAAGNMMNSYAQGQKEAFDKAKIEFDENMRVVEQQNAQVKEMLSQSLQLAKTNLTAAQAKLESDLKSKGYDLLAAAAKKGGITAVAQSWDQISKDLVAGKQVIDSLGGGYTEAVGPNAEVARIFGPQAAKQLEPKDAEKLMGKLRAVKQTTDLLKEADDPDIKFGEASTFVQRAKALLNRNLGSDKDDISYQQLNQNIDDAAKSAGLSPVDKNVVFYKKAVFAALELERQARGGSLLPVAVMRQLGPLLDPLKTDRESYKGIIADRANQVANETGLTQEQLVKGLSGVGNLQAVRPVVSAPKTIETPNAEKKIAKKEDIEATMKATNLSRDEVIKRLKAKGFQVEGE